MFCLELNVEQKNHLMPHPRHFNEAYINQMCANIGSFFVRFQERFIDYVPRVYDGPFYRFLHLNEMEGDFSLVEKSNSVFSVKLFSLKGELRFSGRYDGCSIVAVNAWCDDYSSLEISSSSETVIKNFKSLYVSTEFVKPIVISPDTVLKVNYINVPATENTLLVKFEPDSAINPLLLEGFLVCDNTLSPSVPELSVLKCTDHLDISKYVLPNWRPFAAAAKTLVTLLR